MPPGKREEQGPQSAPAILASIPTQHVGFGASRAARDAGHSRLPGEAPCRGSDAARSSNRATAARTRRATSRSKAARSGSPRAAARMAWASARAALTVRTSAVRRCAARARSIARCARTASSRIRSGEEPATSRLCPRWRRPAASRRERGSLPTRRAGRSPGPGVQPCERADAGSPSDDAEYAGSPVRCSPWRTTMLRLRHLAGVKRAIPAGPRQSAPSGAESILALPQNRPIDATPSATRRAHVDRASLCEATTRFTTPDIASPSSRRTT